MYVFVLLAGLYVSKDMFCEAFMHAKQFTQEPLLAHNVTIDVHFQDGFFMGFPILQPPGDIPTTGFWFVLIKGVQFEDWFLNRSLLWNTVTESRIGVLAVCSHMWSLTDTHLLRNWLTHHPSIVDCAHMQQKTNEIQNKKRPRTRRRRMA